MPSRYSTVTSGGISPHYINWVKRHQKGYFVDRRLEDTLPSLKTEERCPMILGERYRFAGKTGVYVGLLPAKEFKDMRKNPESVPDENAFLSKVDMGLRSIVPFGFERTDRYMVFKDDAGSYTLTLPIGEILFEDQVKNQKRGEMNKKALREFMRPYYDVTAVVPGRERILTLDDAVEWASLLKIRPHQTAVFAEPTQPHMPLLLNLCGLYVGVTEELQMKTDDQEALERCYGKVAHNLPTDVAFMHAPLAVAGLIPPAHTLVLTGILDRLPKPMAELLVDTGYGLLVDGARILVSPDNPKNKENVEQLLHERLPEGVTLEKIGEGLITDRRLPDGSPGTVYRLHRVDEPKGCIVTSGKS